MAIAAAAPPAVGTDGSAAAAADHGCLLVIVWLQCGTTTIYTYMNTLQLESKIKSSPSSFLQGIPTQSASGNSSFDDDSRFLLLLLPTLDLPPIWQLWQGKKKTFRAAAAVSHLLQGQVCILNYPSKQASKAFFNWHPLLSMVCVEQNLFFSTCLG